MNTDQYGEHRHWTEHAEAEERKLLATFRERRLSIATMDTPLRLATGGAMASLLGAAVLVVLRDKGSPVPVGVTEGVLTTLSTPLFVAALALLALGFGYVLTGAVLGHRPLAVLTVLAITGVLGIETGVLGIGGLKAVLPGWARLTTRLLLAAICVVAAAAIVYRRGRHGDAPADRGLRVALLVTYCAIFGAYLGILRLATPDANGIQLFPLTITVLMGGLALLTIPILQVAAIDFGEWGQLTAEAILRGAGRGRLASTGRLAVPLIACGGLIAVGWQLMRGTTAHRLHNAAIGIAFLAGILALLLLAGALLRVGRQGWPESVNFAGLFVVVAISLWLVAPLSGWAAGAFKLKPTPTVSEQGTFTAAAQVQRTTAPGGATLLVPAGWHSSKPSSSIYLFSDSDPTLGKLIMLIAHGSLGGQSVGQLAQQVAGATPDGGPEADGPWQRVEVKPKPPDNTGMVWAQQPAGQPQGYLIYGMAQTSDAEPAGRMLEAIVNTFRLPGQAPAPLPTTAAEENTPAAVAQANDDHLLAFGAAMDVGISLVALALLVLAGRRRWSGRIRIALLFFAVLTLVTIAYRLDSIGRVLAGRAAAWPVLTEAGLLTGVGVLGIAALLATIGRRDRWTWAGRLPRTLSGLAVGVLTLRLIDILYARALSATHVAVWAAVVLLVAVAWDVTMSGESLTNHASRLIPRSSRVFLFFGYVILLSSAVVFYSGQHVAASGATVSEVYFEPESVTQAALFTVAFPLMLLLFVLQSFTSASPEAAPEPPEPSTDPSGAVAVAAAPAITTREAP